MKWISLVLLISLVSCQTSSVKQSQGSYPRQVENLKIELEQLLSETISQMNGMENRVSVCMKLSRLKQLTNQLKSKGVAIDPKLLQSGAVSDYCLYKSNLNPAKTSISMARAKNQLILWRQNYLN